MKYNAFLGAVCFLSAAFTISSKEIVLQEGSSYSGCEDTYIRSQRPSENYGSEDKIGSKYEFCSA